MCCDTLQPQDVVWPLLRSLDGAKAVPPQSQRHSHRRFPAGVRRSVSDTTKSFPNFFPVRSLKFPLMSILRFKEVDYDGVLH